MARRSLEIYRRVLDAGHAVEPGGRVAAQPAPLARS